MAWGSVVPDACEVMLGTAARLGGSCRVVAADATAWLAPGAPAPVQLGMVSVPLLCAQYHASCESDIVLNRGAAAGVLDRTVATAAWNAGVCCAGTQA